LLGQYHAMSLALASDIEQAEFYLLRVLGVERKVNTLSIPG
jgi:hypothetical protein